VDRSTPDGFLAYLKEMVGIERFDQLKLPLMMVTTEFWKREEVILDSGLLIPAVHASMALPGLFAPVTLDGRLLVDGGLVNPVPYDLLGDDCDITIAVNVIARHNHHDNSLPSALETLFEAYQILQSTVMREKLGLFLTLLL
jgi:NTE family protein